MARFLWLVLFYALYSSVAGVLSSESNIQLSITEKGLAYVNKALVNNLVEQVGGLAIPTVNINQWGIQLKLYNAKVKTVSMKSASLDINNGVLQLTVRLSHIGIGGNYSYHGWFGSGKNRFTAKMNNVLIVQDLSIGHNNKGKPVIEDDGCATLITKSDYKFRKSFLLTLVAKLAKKHFQSKIEKLICKAVTKAIKEKGKRLPALYPDGFTLQANRDCLVEVTYPITRHPIVEADSVDFLITGKVKSSCHLSNVSSNVPRVNLTRYIPSHDKMMSISLSDQFLNSLAKVYFEVGRMTRTFTVSMQRQGNSSTNVQIKMQATSSPVIHTTKNGSSMIFSAKATINGPASLGKILLLQEYVLVKTELIVQEEKKTLSLKLKNVGIQQALGSGAFQPKSQIFQLIQKHIPKVTEAFNQSFRKMVPLPVIHKMQLKNQQISYKRGYVILQVDVSF